MNCFQSLPAKACLCLFVWVFFLGGGGGELRVAFVWFLLCFTSGHHCTKLQIHHNQPKRHQPSPESVVRLQQSAYWKLVRNLSSQSVSGLNHYCQMNNTPVNVTIIQFIFYQIKIIIESRTQCLFTSQVKAYLQILFGISTSLS